MYMYIVGGRGDVHVMPTTLPAGFPGVSNRTSVNRIQSNTIERSSSIVDTN